MSTFNMQEMKASQEAAQKNHEASIKNLENQIGQLAKQMENQSNGRFSGNTQDNPKNESCKAIELRNKKVLNPVVLKRKEMEEVKEDELLVEKEKDEVENETGGVENEKEEKNSEGAKINKKKRDEGENNERLIDVDSIL